MDEKVEQSAAVAFKQQSIAVLVIRLALLLFLVDTAYDLLFFGIVLLPPSQQFHGSVLILFWTAHTVKYVAMTYLLLKVVFQWSNRGHYVNGHYLIERQGVVSVTEKQHELEQLKSVTVQQDWLGKRFNYGTITLKLAASGYSETVVLPDVHNPIACDKMLAKFY